MNGLVVVSGRFLATSAWGVLGLHGSTTNDVSTIIRLVVVLGGGLRVSLTLAIDNRQPVSGDIEPSDCVYSSDIRLRRDAEMLS